MIHRLTWLGLLSFLIFPASCGLPEAPPTIREVTLVAYQAQGGIDLRDPDSEVSFLVDVLLPEGKSLPQVRVEKTWNGQFRTTQQVLTNWPVRVRFTRAELEANWPGFDPAGWRKGNEVAFFLVAGTEQAVQEADPIVFVANCASELEGDYLALTTGKSGPGGGGFFDTLRYEVTLAAVGPGKYEVSELTGGMYPLIWSGKPEAGILTDSCGVLILPAQTDQWGDQLSGTGEEMGNGSLLYRWENGYGDRGETLLIRR